MIQVRGVGMRYGRGLGEVEVLRDIDLDIEQGEHVAIMGPSGSGKSTLLHLMGLLDVPTVGTIEINGQPASTLGPRPRARLRNRTLGFVFQSFHLLAHLSAEENVLLPAVLAGGGANGEWDRVRSLLEIMGVAELRHRFPGEMSGGQQQRVAIARALMLEPPILLADEPTGNLDSAASAVVLDLLEHRHREGQTIVMVTHSADVAGRADRIIELRDGRLVPALGTGSSPASPSGETTTTSPDSVKPVTLAGLAEPVFDPLAR